MAYGIENARIVLVFLSEPYFNSKNCKKELNYADILDKKGFQIGATSLIRSFMI